MMMQKEEKKRNVIPLSKIEFQGMKNLHSIVDDLPRNQLFWQSNYHGFTVTHFNEFKYDSFLVMLEEKEFTIVSLVSGLRQIDEIDIR